MKTTAPSKPRGSLRRRVLLAALAALACAAAGPLAATEITLTEPLQRDDICFVGQRQTPSAYYICIFRPSTGTTVYQSASLGSVNEYWAFAFNRKTGDFYYSSGYANANHFGYELRRIRAGETNSTLVIADLATTVNCRITGIAVARDGTLYAAQDYDNGSEYANRGVIRRFLPDGAGGYLAGTNWKKTTRDRTGAAEFSLTRDDKFILLAGGHTALNWAQVYRTSNGALVQEILGDSGGTANAWVGYPPYWLTIDYTRTPDSSNRLRLLQLGGRLSATDLIDTKVPNRVSELAFDPATGVITNLSLGTGNVTGNVNAMSLVERHDGNNISSPLIFDHQGRLIILPVFSTTQARRFTQAQLSAQDPLLNISSGTAIWTFPFSFNSFSKAAIAEGDLPKETVVLIF